MSDYNRRDVLETSMGVALMAGGILSAGGAASVGATGTGSNSLPKTDKPAGWISANGSARNANYIADGPEFGANTFESVWEYDKARSRHPYLGGDRIAVADGTVYSGAATMDKSVIHREGMVALSTADGSVEWKNETAFGDPTVTEDTVYCVRAQSEAQLHALDRADGSHRWTVDIGNDRPIQSSPTVAHGAVYLISGETVYAFETDDGSLRWSRQSDELNVRSFWGTPAVANGLVFISSEQAFGFDPKTGDVAWELPYDGSAAPRVAASSTTLAVAGTNTTWLYDIETQEEIAAVPGSSSLALGTQVAVCMHENYEEHGLFAVDLETGDRLWEVPEGGVQPVIVGETVYFHDGSSGKLIAFDKYDGTTKWESKLDHGYIQPTLVVGTEMLYLLGGGRLTAYRNTSTTPDDGDEDDDQRRESESDANGSDGSGPDGGTNNDGESESTDGEDGDTAGDSDESSDTDTSGDTVSNDTDSAPGTELNGTDADESNGSSGDAEEPSNEPEDDSDKAESTPGFGIVGGLASTVGGAALAARRLIASDESVDRD
ncbi:PQQ-binding-like beta-propeller repeat protein [Natrinema halophilum]|uniref:PQQ-binding-like beta-propeller repeat protein n=1 Tax=Natrinema halophilum TaxID=1699371 RepID=A0A7D5KF88_9EURY|nr:PQQ-binding-like beta-propeller repeat protein [Natrinema halophilum]QLG50956.1 PQQ-binding-like beta-propeller repeat protein [Natrinema halophilum]